MYIDTATSMLNLLSGLPQTTSADGYSDTVSRISNHVTRAESVVNGKVARRYDVSGWSTASHPPLLKTLSEDICSYFVTRAYFTGDNQNDNEWVDKYKDAMDILEQLLNGDMDLLDENNSLIDERSTANDDRVESNTEDYAPTFAEDNVLSSKVDSDKLSDIASNRD